MRGGGICSNSGGGCWQQHGRCTPLSLLQLPVTRPVTALPAAAAAVCSTKPCQVSPAGTFGCLMVVANSCSSSFLRASSWAFFSCGSTQRHTPAVRSSKWLSTRKKSTLPAALLPQPGRQLPFDGCAWLDAPQITGCNIRTSEVCITGRKEEKVKPHCYCLLRPALSLTPPAAACLPNTAAQSQEAALTPRIAAAHLLGLLCQLLGTLLLGRHARGIAAHCCNIPAGKQQHSAIQG